MIAVVLDGMDLTDALWAVLEPRVVLAVARTGAARRGPSRALQLRGEITEAGQSYRAQFWRPVVPNS